MASRLEDSLCCSVCHEIFKEPVILSCTHSFCRDCLQRWWKEKQAYLCPICMKLSKAKPKPPLNRVLQHLCEVFLQERQQAASEDLCSLHSEKLKLFCLDHQQPVCLVCRDSEKHNNHRFRPIDEVAQQHKKELQESLEPLKKQLKSFEGIKVIFGETGQHINVQTQRIEMQIKEQFKELHQFLQEEEEARISALREEEKQKSQRIKEKMVVLSRVIAALSDTIRATEDELRAEDVTFLHNYKAAVEQVQQRPLLEGPQLPSGALIDEAKHLGNMTFNVWSKMKNMVSCSPVILDPNTVNTHLILSADLTGLRAGPTQEPPLTEERIDDDYTVLGSEGFNSGSHSWDVEVGNSTEWSLGVLAESAYITGDIYSGLWRLWFFLDDYIACSPSHPNIELEMQKFQRIRVNLDCNRGKLSFSDADTNTHIHTFRHAFTERMFPYIRTQCCQPLNILPMNVSVAVEQQKHMMVVVMMMISIMIMLLLMLIIMGIRMTSTV